MAQFKVVITDFGAPDNDLEAAVLQDSGLDIELVRLNAFTPEELIPVVKDADGLIVQWAKITRDIIQSLEKCKVISRYGIGVDMVDLAAAGECGIPVCNVPDYCIEEVSTHTMSFLLMLNRHILIHHNHVKSGKWGGVSGGPPGRLSSQTLGVIGMGNIGRAVVQKARCLGLRVLVYDPYVRSEQAADLGVELVNLDTLLQQSDYVSLHCPLTDETRHLINKERLEMMKPTAYLINMARGPIVDQPALYQALVDGKISAAALDVLEKEPPDPDDPLFKLDNVIFTPHTSSWSAQSFVQLRQETARNVVIVLKGEPPRAVVNRKELSKVK